MERWKKWNDFENPESFSGILKWEEEWINQKYQSNTVPFEDPVDELKNIIKMIIILKMKIIFYFIQLYQVIKIH